MTVTRVFMNGNSQAVRIPQELRLDATQVDIHRNALGELVISPVAADRGQALLQALHGFDEDFARALEQDRADQWPAQDREAL
jgi:antitoxin VapB